MQNELISIIIFLLVGFTNGYEPANTIYGHDTSSINVECQIQGTTCDAYVTTKTGAYQTTAPFILELEIWQEAHVTINGELTLYRNNGSYVIPDELCQNYEWLSVMIHCGWYSVAATSALVATIATFVIFTAVKYNK